MIDEIIEQIKQGKYYDIEKRFEMMNNFEIRDVMMNIAYSTESICTYSFICYMIQQKGTVNWINLAIDILLNPLCFIEGAYAVALFHTRQLWEFDKSSDVMKKILFFYDIPEKLIGEEEAIEIAKKLLVIEPNNEIAISILESQHNISG